LPIVFALAAALAGSAAEPSLAETQEAAARLAGGEAAEDDSRASRARLSHLAPQLRTQAGQREDLRERHGQTLREDSALLGRTWSVLLSWDFSQLVYAREESPLAQAHAHLARARREAADQAAHLWIERRRARRALAQAQAPRRLEACLELLRLTAALDALTSGLFRDAVSREEAACAEEEKQ
jgi:hypothetical protein